MTNEKRREYYWAHRTPNQLLNTHNQNKSREGRLKWKAGEPSRHAARTVMRLLKHQSLQIPKYRTRAKERFLAFDLKFLDLDIPEFCPILGIRLSFDSDCQSPNAPSVDRIDNARGYVRGNVQVISFRANVLKRNATMSELLALGQWAKNFGQNV